MNYQKIIDVSKHNDVLNWQAIKSAGIDGAIIRAGYVGEVDPQFKANIAGALSNGLKIGIYWFSYALTQNAAINDAAQFTTVINPYKAKIELGVWYDFEYDTERYAKEKGVIYTQKLRTDIIVEFCNRMNSNGYNCGIYTNADYIKNRLEYDRLKQYPLWIASWLIGANYYYVKPEAKPKAYGDAVIWQFAQNGKIPNANSVNGNFDLNYGYFEEEEKELTKAEIEKIVEDKFNELKAADDKSKLPCSDWAQPATKWAIENKIFNGDGNGVYRWGDNITREEVAQVLYNLKK